MYEFGRLAVVVDHALYGLAIVRLARYEEHIDGQADYCVQVVESIDRVVVVALKEAREDATYLLYDHRPPNLSTVLLLFFLLLEFFSKIKSNRKFKRICCC